MKMPPLLPPSPLLLLLSLVITTTTTTATTVFPIDCYEAIPTTPEKLPVALKSINDLGFQTLRLLSDMEENPSTNLMISSFSLWRMLSTLAVGAEGDTLKQILNVLNLRDKRGIIYLSEAIRKRYISDVSADNITLSDAAQIFMNKGTNINRCKVELKHEITHVDFSDRDKACRTIDWYVEGVTRGLIPKFMEPKMILPDTPMVLVNAFYFRGRWKNRFDKSLTRKMNFYLLEPPNTSVKVDMMYKRRIMVKNVRSDTLEAIVLQLPYAGGAFMTILKPLEYGVSGLQNTLNSLRSYEAFKAATDQLTESRIDIYLPKFRVHSSIGKELVKAMMSLELRDAFTPAADFSSFDNSMYIKWYIHKTVIEVDEEGTEAAGAGAAISKSRNLPLQIALNRPFVFVIHTNDVVLFTGVFTNPLLKN